MLLITIVFHGLISICFDTSKEENNLKNNVRYYIKFVRVSCSIRSARKNTWSFWKLATSSLTAINGYIAQLLAELSWASYNVNEYCMVLLPWLSYGSVIATPNTVRELPFFISILRPFTDTVTATTQLARPRHRSFLVKTKNELSKSFANTYWHVPMKLYLFPSNVL